MVSRALVDRLSKAVEQVAVTHDPSVRLVVFAQETVEAAQRRHLSLRPEHTNRRMVIEWRRELRDAVTEMLAVATLEEIAEAVEAASDQKDGRLIGAEAQRDRARASANKSSESR